MRARDSFVKMLVAALALSLLPGLAAAQRRVLGGAKPTETKPAESAPAAPGPSKEEPKSPAPAPAPAPAPTAPASDAVAPEKLGADKERESKVSAPAILVPKDEQGQPEKAAGRAVVAAEPQESVYRKKIDKNVIVLHVRPARPLPAQPVTLTVELQKLLPIPDPAIGDRAPVEGATVLATITRDGKGATPSSYLFHPMSDSGVYGVRFSVPEHGRYKVEIAQRPGPNAEVAERPIGAEFVLGIGEATPMEASQEEGAIKAGKGRSALRVADAKHKEGPAELMRSLGEHWMALMRGLETNLTLGELQGHAKAIAELAGKLPGQVPLSMAIDGREFDALAQQLAKSAAELPAVAGDRAGAKAQVTRMEQDLCLRCHTKFRFRIADELSSWPTFEPKAPSASRRP